MMTIWFSKELMESVSREDGFIAKIASVTKRMGYKPRASSTAFGSKVFIEDSE